MGGFSKREIDDAQTRNGLTFPPDLIELLQHQRSLICHDGRRFDFTCMSGHTSVARSCRYILTGHCALMWNETLLVAKLG